MQIWIICIKLRVYIFWWGRFGLWKTPPLCGGGGEGVEVVIRYEEEDLHCGVSAIE